MIKTLWVDINIQGDVNSVFTESYYAVNNKPDLKTVKRYKLSFEIPDPLPVVEVTGTVVEGDIE